ncbi:MAG: NADH-quinone oxidoreductase subunit NuoN [Alphaproteobacteria bacterium]|nr:NADH-quinone oxidoreductase subunit NuoN [Alphaproteobacteria bacterium]
MIDLQDFMVTLPVIEVALIALASLVAAAVWGEKAVRALGGVAIGAFLLALATMYCPVRFETFVDGTMPVLAFGSHFIDDGFARFAKTIILIASSLSVLLSWDYFEKEGHARAEYPVLILFVTLGMMLMVSASDLLSLYVGLELQSLSLYVLAAFNRDDSRSTEAGLKYFVLGSLSSGVLLYGASLIYGFAGATDFASLSALLRETSNPGVAIGMAFVGAGLVFKLAGVPFHMWAPDVYDGAPTPVTAFFATAPKLAALALLTRFVLSPMDGLSAQWHQAVMFVAVASMLWGAFAGLAQTRLKRLLAYSSIANVGYLLVGLLAGGEGGVQAILIYFAIYALNTLGIFALVLCLRREGRAVDSIDDLSGLSKTHPLAALAMAVLMFSIAGIPPLAGFFGKYVVFLAAVKTGFVPVAVIGVLSSVVAAFFYLRIVKVMYFDEPLLALDPLPGWGVRFVLGFSSVAMVALAVLPEPLIQGAVRAAESFSG